MATAHNRKTCSDRLLWHALNCFLFKIRLQYRRAEINKKKDPRETKVDPKWPRSSLVIHCKYHSSTDHQKHHLKFQSRSLMILHTYNLLQSQKIQIFWLSNIFKLSFKLRSVVTVETSAFLRTVTGHFANESFR